MYVSYLCRPKLEFAVNECSECSTLRIGLQDVDQRLCIRFVTQRLSHRQSHVTPTATFQKFHGIHERFDDDVLLLRWWWGWLCHFFSVGKQSGIAGRTLVCTPGDGDGGCCPREIISRNMCTYYFQNPFLVRFSGGGGVIFLFCPAVAAAVAAAVAVAVVAAAA